MAWSLLVKQPVFGLQNSKLAVNVFVSVWSIYTKDFSMFLLWLSTFLNDSPRLFRGLKITLTTRVPFVLLMLFTTFVSQAAHSVHLHEFLCDHAFSALMSSYTRSSLNQTSMEVMQTEPKYVPIFQSEWNVIIYTSHKPGGEHSLAVCARVSGK